jgi:hypothetical protein
VVTVAVIIRGINDLATSHLPPSFPRVSSLGSLV